MVTKIEIFPSALHRTIVETIARRMAACANLDDAQDELVAHLEVHWDRLEAFGVDSDEIERDCRQFSKAAWGRYQQFSREEGVA